MTMKRYTALSALTFLLLAGANQCFAAMEIEHVSKERAKKLGMELRLKESPASKEVWVELEFKAEGELKDFVHVSLEIRDGKNLLVGRAPLHARPSTSGHVLGRFMTNRAYLDKVTLRVVTGHVMDYTGYDLHVKDFVDLEKPR
jgi:hypothetical protein